MSSIYHVRGFWCGLLRQPAWHVREWFRNPAYRALHRFHRELRGLPRFTPAQLTFQGRTIRLCDGPSFLSAWDEIFVNRIYDVPLESNPRPVLVDAGANIGLAALYWKWRYGDVHYLGYEPDPRIAACCRDNLQAWNIAGEVVTAAVGAEEGRAAFFAEGADGGHLVAGRPGSASTIEVAVERLTRRLPARVDLLKIDVEGAETEVLREVGPLLDRVRALFVEWHSRPRQPGLGAAIAQLEAAGFDCYVQVASGPDPVFHVQPPPDGYAQNVNLYAVRP